MKAELIYTGLTITGGRIALNDDDPDLISTAETITIHLSIPPRYRAPKRRRKRLQKKIQSYVDSRTITERGWITGGSCENGEAILTFEFE